MDAAYPLHIVPPRLSLVFLVVPFTVQTRPLRLFRPVSVLQAKTESTILIIP